MLGGWNEYSKRIWYLIRWCLAWGRCSIEIDIYVIKIHLRGIWKKWILNYVNAVNFACFPKNIKTSSHLWNNSCFQLCTNLNKSTIMQGGCMRQRKSLGRHVSSLSSRLKISVALPVGQGVVIFFIFLIAEQSLFLQMCLLSPCCCVERLCL